MSDPKPKERVVGLTKDAGFQIGVRKTFHIPQPVAWDALISPQGLRLWLGELDELPGEKGAQYLTADGTRGEVRASSNAHVRLTWQLPGWDAPSTLQVRAIPQGEKTVIVFHQERLADAEQREAMRAHWQWVMDQLEELFA